MHNQSVDHYRDQPPQPYRLGWIISLTLFSLLLGGTVQRAVPGGPFISITSDILPAAASLTSIWLGLLALRGHNSDLRIVALVFILLATLALSRIMIDMYSFWNFPYARGELFGL